MVVKVNITCETSGSLDARGYPIFNDKAHSARFLKCSAFIEDLPFPIIIIK
jgi:hypothetical protein